MLGESISVGVGLSNKLFSDKAEEPIGVVKCDGEVDNLDIGVGIGVGDDVSVLLT